ncbi:MAG: type II secretion system protein M [Gammaproteobacteria bacterium]|nr:type II secretion system protein M [Gammaproteobacteria bacterium]
MKEYLASLQQRERNLVYLMAGFVLLALGYFAAYQPVDQRLQRATASLEREVSLQQWLETNATKLVKLRADNGQAKTSSVGLDQLVNRSARQLGLTINRLQPQNNKLNVTLEQAKFNTVLQWLAVLQQQHGVKLNSVDFRSESTPGMVRVRVLLGK